MPRKQNRQPQTLRFETLEPRQLMTVNLYLDFGMAFETVRSTSYDSDRILPHWDAEYPSGDDFGIPNDPSFVNSLEDSLNDLQGGIDYNGDGVAANAEDVQALAQDVLRIVQRLYEPFDVNVQIASAANWDDVASTLAAHNSNDAYIIVGGSGTAFGVAPLDDGNLKDDVGYTFAEDLIVERFNEPGMDKGYLATALAVTAAHEAAHSFGLAHLYANPPVVQHGGLMADTAHSTVSGDRFSVVGLIYRGWNFAVDEHSSVNWTTQDDYQRLADTLGTRPGAPAYVSGTSLHDVITIANLGGGQASVNVRAYLDAGKTNLYGEIQYQISTNHGVLVEAGLGDDLIDARSLYANVTMRGGDGNDVLWGGVGNDTLAGEAGDDELLGGLGGDTYQFGFGVADQGADTIQDKWTYEYSYNPNPNIDTLDFSHFRGPVSVDLNQYSTSWWSRTYQTISDGANAQLRLAIMKAANTFYFVRAGAYIENVIGTEYRDNITGDWLNNTLDGRGDSDTIRGGDGDDTLMGGDAVDYLFGNDGLDQLFGERGDDHLDGGADSYADVLVGGPGRDTFFYWYGYSRETMVDYTDRWDRVGSTSSKSKR